MAAVVYGQRQRRACVLQWEVGRGGGDDDDGGCPSVLRWVVVVVVTAVVVVIPVIPIALIVVVSSSSFSSHSSPSLSLSCRPRAGWWSNSAVHDLYPLLVNTPDLVRPLPTLDLHPSSIPVDTPIPSPGPLLLHSCFALPFHNPCP